MSGFADVDYSAGVVSKSAAYSATNTDFVVLCTASSAFTVTLPPLTGVASGHVIIVAKDNGANAITVAANGTDKFNNIASGSQSLSASAAHSALMLATPTTWILVSTA